MRTAALLAALTVPWWDNFPTTVQTADPEVAAAYLADSCLSGMADDPCWGIHGTRVRYFSQARNSEAMRRAGLKMLTWTETFGTCEQYIATFTRGADGRFEGFTEDPTTPRTVLNHWCWQLWKPEQEREIRWVGLPSYYEDEPWARPWTRTHPRYGAPPFTYPDGREALGYVPGEGGLRLHRLYDAGCSKDVLGGIATDYGFNASVNEIDPQSGEVRGPTEGLVRCETGDGVRYAGVVSFGKDSACPHWIEYARASARQLADFGVEGLWADNFSAWDGFGNPPVRTAFGDWSVACFRGHLKEHTTAQELQRLGVPRPEDFDVRAYLRDRLSRDFGGDDTNLDDPRWRDPRWLDDPVWLRFMVYKAQTILRALQDYHDTFHRAADEAGIEDFVIQGNDIPMWSLGMPRREALEMVSTEYSPGWSLMGGPRGLGMPPRGRIAPLIRMARCYQQSRFVHVWYYLHGDFGRYRGNAAVGRLLGYELLANHAMIQAHPSQDEVAGTDDSHTEINRFIRACRPVWADRRPLAPVALLYSPASRLAAMTPGGTLDFAAQSHAFDLIGWGTALSELHYQYEAIAEWDLSAAALADKSLLVLPSVEALGDPAISGVLTPWVRAGGTLLLSGPAALRHDASGSFARVGADGQVQPSLCALLGLPAEQPLPRELDRRVGAGRVVVVGPLGFAYYQTDWGARDPAPIAEVLAATCGRASVRGAGLCRELEVVVYRSPGSGALFVDVANLDMNPDEADAPTPHRLKLRLPFATRAGQTVEAVLLQPDLPPQDLRVRLTGGTAYLAEFDLRHYASVVLRAVPGG